MQLFPCDLLAHSQSLSFLFPEPARSYTGGEAGIYSQLCLTRKPASPVGRCLEQGLRLSSGLWVCSVGFSCGDWRGDAELGLSETVILWAKRRRFVPVPRPLGDM